MRTGLPISVLIRGTKSVMEYSTLTVTVVLEELQEPLSQVGAERTRFAWVRPLVSACTR